MQKRLQGFICGLIVAALCFGTAYAAVTLRKAEFNTNAYYFNGEKVDLDSQPMISVIKDGETDMRSYAPVRMLLEGAGLGVAWSADEGAVYAFSQDYLEASDEWVRFEDLQAIIDAEPNIPEHRFTYDEARHTVHVIFDARHEWDLLTAVVDGAVYVEKAGIDNVLIACSLNAFDEYTP